MVTVCKPIKCFNLDHEDVNTDLICLDNYTSLLHNNSNNGCTPPPPPTAIQ